MAQAGYMYEVELKDTHLNWGTVRYTGSRPSRQGEAYIPIPSNDAYSQIILNTTGTNGQDVLGQNIFRCSSVDGFFKGVLLKAQGSQYYTTFAKQFSVNDSLRTLGDWYQFVNAQVGDHVRVLWTSPTDILIEKL